MGVGVERKGTRDLQGFHIENCRRQQPHAAGSCQSRRCGCRNTRPELTHNQERDVSHVEFGPNQRFTLVLRVAESNYMLFPRKLLVVPFIYIRYN